jgi:hypothetical protein
MDYVNMLSFYPLSWELLLCGLLAGIFAAGIIWINVWYWQQRSRSSKEEFKLTNESLRNPGDW